MAEKQEDKPVHAEATFFSKMDRNAEGAISSEYPVWMMEAHTEKLRDAVDQQKNALEMGYVKPGELASHRASLERNSRKLQEITDARPKFTAVVDNKLNDEYKKLKVSIGASMFTRDEMMKGLADPAKEAKRMVLPCVDVNPEIARMCGVSVKSDNKASRNEASKIFKILGRYFGEESNTEALRRDSRRG